MRGPSTVGMLRQHDAEMQTGTVIKDPVQSHMVANGGRGPSWHDATTIYHNSHCATSSTATSSNVQQKLQSNIDDREFLQLLEESLDDFDRPSPRERVTGGCGQDS